MENLSICTWNIKNSYIKLSENKSKVAGLMYLLGLEKPDIVSLQEVNRELFSDIKKALKKEMPDYKIYPNIKKTQLTFNNVIDEFNPIITHEKVAGTGNFKLPSIPNEISFDIHLRRINEIAFENSNTFILNTHLEHKIDELNYRQLKRVSDRIMYLKAHYENPDIIITGNLNKFPTHSNILSWKRNDLNDFGLKILELNKATYTGHTGNQPVDYIIVPNSYKLEDIKILKQLDGASSHLPVLAKVKVR